ncbi:DNA polymerase I [Pseudomonas phage BroderSalsa]|nr:DNA polymerase I [Pseudomonas phage BroderSalsa]
MKGWGASLGIESKVASIISRQSRHGVAFNKQKAQWFIHVLTERILNIDLVAVPQMPKMVKASGAFSKPFKKNGQPCSRLVDYWDNYGEFEVSGPFTAIKFEDFDMGKTGLFKDWMIDNGWKPSQWNTKDLTVGSDGKKLKGSDLNESINRYIDDLRSSKTGRMRMILQGIKPGITTLGEVRRKLERQRKVLTTPKLTEDSLHTVEGELGTLVMQRMVWSHRRSLLQGLVEQTRADGRLEAGANSCATPTGRMRHRTVVNIPAARSLFGPEIRSLFTGTPSAGDWDGQVIKKELKGTERVIPYTNQVEAWDKKEEKWIVVSHYRKYIPKGQLVFVGYDGAGLELRMFAHYVNDPAYTLIVTEGDIHTANQVAAGLPTRDNAKTFIYAFLYGAGDAKLGSIIGGTSKDGAAIRAAFLAAYPTLAKLIEATKELAAKGYLIGLDGRKLIMRRSEDGNVAVHKALNTLLQAAGAVVMKWAMVRLDEEVKRLGLRAWKVLDVHDEGQWEVHPEDVPAIRALMEDCVAWAGKRLGLNCPLASDSQVGASWYDTH